VSLREYHDGATAWRDLIDQLDDADVTQLERLEAVGELDNDDLLDLARHRVDIYAPQEEDELGHEPDALCGIPRWIYLSDGDPNVRAFVDRPPLGRERRSGGNST
jgi:hypothetical protein